MLIEFLVIVISNKEIHQMAITVYKQKTIDKNFKKKIKKKNLNFFFFSKRPETESRNSGDHEL